MGEIAEMMLDGTMCECCGEFLPGEGEGVPRYCSSQCARDRGALYPAEDYRAPAPSNPLNTSCPLCRKRVRKAGLDMHLVTKHPKRKGQTDAN